MDGHAFRAILTTLAEQYGRLDNQVERWAGHHEGLLNLFPEIRQTLADHFAPGCAPIQIFARGSETYSGLLSELLESGNDAQDTHTAAAYLNLRFYILLNGFLQACHESLQKSALNPSLDPAELVQKSYYTPYFFERSSLSSTEITQMLKDEIEKLRAAPRDRSSIMLAMRIRKGVYATLAESFCPLHPHLYPLVQELDAIRASSDPAVMDAVQAKLEEILAAI